MKPDIWDMEFRSIYINPEKLKEQAKRYRMDVRFALGYVNYHALKDVACDYAKSRVAFGRLTQGQRILEVS